MGYFSETWKSPFFALEAIGQKMAIFKSHQNTPCGYSKLVPEDVWQDAKGFRSIWSFNPEKTSKMWWKLAILGHFGRFLQTWWMYGPETLCILFSNVYSHTKTDLKNTYKEKKLANRFLSMRWYFWLETTFTVPNPSWKFCWYELHCILI